jgi:hypothetical protein
MDHRGCGRAYRVELVRQTLPLEVPGEGFRAKGILKSLQSMLLGDECHGGCR